MNPMMIRLAEEAAKTIPDRQATIKESLLLMAEGWGGIFVVIIIMMVCILVLNKVFSNKKN